MGVNYNPKINTNGLILCLDAGNKKSYPGSGSTWSDLSGNARNFTLFNTPTFNSAGYISFLDTSFQYATCPSPSNLSSWTAETLVRFTVSTTGKVAMVFGGQYDLVSNLNFSIGTNNAPNDYNISAGFFNGAWRITSGIAVSLNQWYCFTGTYDGSAVKLYNNGVLTYQLNYSGTPTSGGEMRIMRRWDDVATTASNFFAGDVATIKLYNRALTETEIQQNFNAIRGRFGI